MPLWLQVWLELRQYTIGAPDAAGSSDMQCTVPPPEPGQEPPLEPQPAPDQKQEELQQQTAQEGEETKPQDMQPAASEGEQHQQEQQEQPAGSSQGQQAAAGPPRFLQQHFLARFCAAYATHTPAQRAEELELLRALIAEGAFEAALTAMGYFAGLDF